MFKKKKLFKKSLFFSSAVLATLIVPTALTSCSSYSANDPFVNNSSNQYEGFSFEENNLTFTYYTFAGYKTVEGDKNLMKLIESLDSWEIFFPETYYSYAYEDDGTITITESIGQYLDDPKSSHLKNFFNLTNNWINFYESESTNENGKLVYTINKGNSLKKSDLNYSIVKNENYDVHIYILGYQMITIAITEDGEEKVEEVNYSYYNVSLRVEPTEEYYASLFEPDTTNTEFIGYYFYFLLSEESFEEFILSFFLDFFYWLCKDYFGTKGVFINNKILLKLVFLCLT